MTIRRLETITMDGNASFPDLVFLNIHTDDDVVGHGETYYIPTAVEAFIHDFAAKILLGADEGNINGLWQQLYELSARFGALGTEMRAISAIDLALWDIAGKKSGLPVYRLLGGKVRDRIPVYNTCGGPTYGRGTPPAQGLASSKGSMEDLQSFLARPAELAEELLEYGFTAMKIWPFDRFAEEKGGARISNEDLAEGLQPFERIREAVGDQMDIMVEGHGFWSLSAATRIARALEPFEPMWIEDLMLANQPKALRRLRESTSIDVLVSEYLMTRWQYLPMLQEGAADLVMIDPTWCGGITEGQKIASLADVFGLPVTMHDCTGPFTTLAGMHLAASAPNALYQEVVRSYLHFVYPQWVDEVPVVREGHVAVPQRPGLGAELDPKLGQRHGYHSRVSEA